MRFGLGLTLGAIGSGITPPPEFTVAPSISGTTTEGSVLTANPGTFTNGSVTLIEWLRDGSVIPGAVGTTYQCRPADVGLTLSVHVIVVGTGGFVDATSAATAVIAAGTNQVTFASYEGVTFNGTTSPTTAGAYTPDLIGGGTGQTSVFSGTNGRIANGRLWFTAGCILAYGPQRADQSVSARFKHRSVVASTVIGLTLRNGGAASYNGYHVYWVQASGVWRLTNGNTTSLGGAFTDISDSAFSSSNEERIVHFSAIGTTITYTVINPATGSVIGTRTGTNATYSTGWGGVRQQSTTASSETTGVSVEWCTTYTSATATHVFLADGPATVNEDADSTNFVAMIFGTPPATVSCLGTATESATVTPSTALTFSAVHASHPDARQATFVVNPPFEGMHTVSLDCVHLTARLPRSLFSISATPPSIRSAFTVRRGVNTPLNAGDVDLNTLLLTAGYVASWNVSFVSGTGGGLAADWNGIANAQTRFPTPASGATLTGKGYVFRFTSAADGAITVDVTVSTHANVVTVSKQADITAAMGTASSTNTTLAGKTIEIARGSTGFTTEKFYLSRHNSQSTSTSVLTIKNEDDAFAPVLAGIHLFNSNYVTVQGIKTYLTRAQGSALGTTHVYATASTGFSASDKCGVAVVIDGCILNGPAGSVTETCDAVVLNVSTGATITVQNCIMRWVQNGIKTSGALSTQTITSNDIRYFTSNGMILTGTSGLTRIASNGVRSGMRDTSNSVTVPDHLDCIQFGDSSTFGTLELDENLFAAADGNAGLQIIFGNTTVNAGYFRRTLVMNTSGAHAMRIVTASGGFSIYANTLVHQRKTYQANPLVYVDDTLTDGTAVTGTPGITMLTADSSCVVRRVYSQNQVSVNSATLGTGVLTYRDGSTSNVLSANDPATSFTGWTEMATYDWTVDRTLAQFRSEMLRLLKPVSTSALHLGDGTYAGGVANSAGTGIFNDEGTY